jgi:hypothetical protein
LIMEVGKCHNSLPACLRAWGNGSLAQFKSKGFSTRKANGVILSLKPKAWESRGPLVQVQRTWSSNVQGQEKGGPALGGREQIHFLCLFVLFWPSWLDGATALGEGQFSFLHAWTEMPVSPETSLQAQPETKFTSCMGILSPIKPTPEIHSTTSISMICNSHLCRCLSSIYPSIYSSINQLIYLSSIIYLSACHLSLIYLSFIYLSSIIYHLSIIYLSIIYQSSIDHLSIYHLSSLYHLSIINLSSVYHLSIIYLSSI